jgi:hypothetical protein
MNYGGWPERKTLSGDQYKRVRILKDLHWQRGAWTSPADCEGLPFRGLGRLSMGNSQSFRREFESNRRTQDFSAFEV